jgi:predicted nucleic acid-binding protein
LQRPGGRIKVFVDTSVIIAGLAFITGASGTVLDLCDAGVIQMVISRQVLVEADRNISSKLPRITRRFRSFVKGLAPLMLEDPSQASVERCGRFVHRKDAAILAAALEAGAEYLVTLDKRHFLKVSLPPSVPIRVVQPAQFLGEFERLCLQD